MKIKSCFAFKKSVFTRKWWECWQISGLAPKERVQPKWLGTIKETSSTPGEGRY